MTDPALQSLPRVKRKQILARGVRGLCPNCGQAKLFRSGLRIHHRCPHCGMTLERGDGYYLGPLCINYGFVALGIVAPVLLLGSLGVISLAVALALSLAAGLLLPILFYRASWSLWLMLYYFFLPDELHVNRPDNSDDLLFEEEARRRH